MTGDLEASSEAVSRPTGLRLFVIRLCILAASAIIFTLVGEVAVRCLAPQRLTGRWTENGRRGLKVNKANWSARQDAAGQVVTYRFNEHRLRGGPIQGGKRRVLVLGDSFTFGWLLEENETYVARLARLCEQECGHGEYEWLNGARGGWGTADYVAFAEEYGAELRPDVVLVFLNFDDIRRSHVSSLYELDSNALSVTALAQRPSRLTQLSNTIPCYDWLLSNSHFVNLLRSDVNTLLIRLYAAKDAARERALSEVVEGSSTQEESERAIRLGQALFLRLKSWCDQRQCRLVVVTTGFHAKHDPTGQSVDYAFLREAEQFFADANVPFWDNTPCLTQRTNHRWADFTIPGDGHANAAGAKLIAECTWPWLGEQLRVLAR